MTKLENIKSYIKVHQMFFKIIVILAIAVLALLLRLHAAERLGIDKDENLYMSIGEVYKDNFSNLKINEIINTTENIEHPQLAKMLFGTSMLIAEKIGIPTTTTKDKLRVMRIVSVLFAVINVIVISILNPLAGLLMAVTSWHIKYSSEVYLDSVATGFASLAILFYIVSRGKIGKYFVLSAAFIGMGIASKYITITTAITIFIFIIMDSEKKMKKIAIFTGIAIAAFLLFDPILWYDTVYRIKTSVFFHADFTQSAIVKSADFPFYQQLVWFIKGASSARNAFFIKPDLFLLITGLAGIPFLLKKNRLLGVWLLVNLIFLLIYPTKWPQYTMILIPPLALASGEILQIIIRKIGRRKI